MIVYISGKYTDQTVSKVYDNINLARNHALKFWKRGYTVICPHLNSFLMDGEVDYDRFLDGDLEILKKCDYIYLLPNWKKSKGAKIEYAKAKEWGIKRIY